MMDIILITTDGCEACKIQDNIIKSVLSHVGKSAIMYERLDCKDNKTKEFIHKHKLIIDDFPATVILDDDGSFVTKITGTCTANKFEKIIECLNK